MAGFLTSYKNVQFTVCSHKSSPPWAAGIMFKCRQPVFYTVYVTLAPLRQVVIHRLMRRVEFQPHHYKIIISIVWSCKPQVCSNVYVAYASYKSFYNMCCFTFRFHVWGPTSPCLHCMICDINKDSSSTLADLMSGGGRGGRGGGGGGGGDNMRSLPSLWNHLIFLTRHFSVVFVASKPSV